MEGYEVVFSVQLRMEAMDHSTSLRKGIEGEKEMYHHPQGTPEIIVWVEEMNTKRLKRNSQRKDKNQEEYAFGRESFKDRMVPSVKCIWYLKGKILVT